MNNKSYSKQLIMKNLSQDLMSSIGKAKFPSVVGDIMDTVASSEVLKSIPVLGTCLAAYEDSQNISTWYLTKKLYVFLNQLNNLNASEVCDLVYEIDNGDCKVRQHIGEVLIQIIDKSDNIISTAYIALLFRHYVLKKISLDDFLEGARIINNMSITSLQSFLSVSDWSKIDEIDCRDYFRVGLVDRLDIDEVRLFYGNSPNATYKVGKLYKKLSGIGRIVHDCLSSTPIDWNNSRLLQINLKEQE